MPERGRTDIGLGPLGDPPRTGGIDTRRSASGLTGTGGVSFDC